MCCTREIKITLVLSPLGIRSRRENNSFFVLHLQKRPKDRTDLSLVEKKKKRPQVCPVLFGFKVDLHLDSDKSVELTDSWWFPRRPCKS